MLFESTWARLGVETKEPTGTVNSAPTVEDPERVTRVIRETTDPPLTQRALAFEAFEQWQKDEERRKVNDLTVEPEEW